MDEARTSSILFAGDLDDPWVRALAEALPSEAVRISAPIDLPDEWSQEIGQVQAIVLHRAILTNADAARLERLKERATNAPYVILCVGPHARFHQVERWVPLVDVVLPEATASEIVARHLGIAASETPTGGPRPRVSVISHSFELGRALAEGCHAAGYGAEAVRHWYDAPPSGLAVWDVPVLDEDWQEQLAAHTRSRPVVALLGFADRETVAQAREAGAVACLDLPCDPEDLAFVLDRLVSEMGQGRRLIADGAHSIPPAPAGLGAAASDLVRKRGIL